MNACPATQSVRSLVSAILLVGAAVAPASTQEVSVRNVMSAPFPSGLTAGPGVVAWVRNDQGTRNIWMARAPEWTAVQVTRYDGDDGQAITDLQIDPAGDRLIFIRGGAPNRAGEVPNPLSTPEWPERAIHQVALREGAEPGRVAEGGSATLSPDGRHVAFVRSGAIWSVELASGPDDGGSPSDEPTAPEPVRLAEIRGGAGSLRWSPDGTRLAFVSGRGDHAFVGVVEAAGGGLRYLAPSVDRDGSPAWSPDGRRLAFVRQPNVRNALPFEPRREGHPWSLVVADAETGEARTVFQADAGPGSVFRGLEAANAIVWGADDRIVFPWERTGWTTLYSIPASGGEPLALAPGNFEVEYAASTPDGTGIVYASNHDDIDRRHLWHVPVDGSQAPRLLTPGQGIEWAPTPLGDGSVAYLASGATTPAHARIMHPDGTHESLLSDPVPPAFPTDRLVTPTAVTFPAADGMPIPAQLFLPEDLRPGESRPAVVFFHGGSRRQMLLGFHMRDYYHHAYALNQLLVDRGFIVLSVNYRSGIGYGLEFREALDYGARGASEFNDVLGAGLYLANRPDVDPERIGLWGGSYGGYLTAMGLARASHLFAAGVDIHGVHDWNVVVRNFVPSYNAEARAEWSELAYRSSPMADMDGWTSPVLLIHGDDDRNVPFSESVDLAESLRDRGVPFEQLVFPDEVHGFLLHRNWVAAYEATADFLQRKLQRKPAS